MPGIINFGNCEYPSGVDLEIYVRGVCGGGVGGVQPNLKDFLCLNLFYRF